MKTTIKVKIAIICCFVFTISQAQNVGKEFNYDSFASLPNELGALVLDTSVPELANSYETYYFTKEDALWMARFVKGEAGVKNNADGHAVLWAMFNRFGILRHQAKSWTSFGAFLQKYSTTLQPMLKSKGAAKRAYKNHLKDSVTHQIVIGAGYYKDSNLRKVQYKRHIDLQNTNWEDIPMKIRKMVLSILQGEVQNPGIGIATEFAGTHIYYKQKHDHKPTPEQWRVYTINHAQKNNWQWIKEKTGLNQRTKNAFFVDNRFKNVPEDAIWVVPLY